MIPTSEVKQVLREVYRKRGYIVIGTKPGASYLRGAVVTQIFQYKVGAPFKVESYTNAADWKKQTDLIAELRPTWRRLPEAKKKGKFYRLVPARQRALKSA